MVTSVRADVKASVGHVASSQLTPSLCSSDASRQAKHSLLSHLILADPMRQAVLVPHGIDMETGVPRGAERVEGVDGGKEASSPTACRLTGPSCPHFPLPLPAGSSAVSMPLPSGNVAQG